MLTIGEFSNICKVSTKTLRYYAEIGLILPEVINSDTGYRYYSIHQLETMLFINRLKTYNFSLEEIKSIIDSKASGDDFLCKALMHKQTELQKQIQLYQQALTQIEIDISSLKQGKSLMSYLEDIDVQLIEAAPMRLLSIRKYVYEDNIENEYRNCYAKLFEKIIDEGLTVLAPPMVLFHNAEFMPSGLDIEFAVPIQENVKGSRDFNPGLCLKTILKGSYTKLPSVYAKQCEWAEREGFETSDALYEVYVSDPLQCNDESELVTEIYYPVKKANKKRALAR